MSDLHFGVQINAMTTQTLPAQAKSEMLTLKKILVPSDFLPASDNAQRNRGIGGIRSRRRTFGARGITSRSFSPKATALCRGTAGDAEREERTLETTVGSMANRVALHPFLAGMNPRQLALLTACAMAVQFKKGQVIFREGEPADWFYLIETGKVILESSEGGGDSLLGWSWMFPPHTWNVTARAVEPITAIFFRGETLREYCEKDHSLGYELLKRMSLLIYGRMQVARNKTLTSHHRSDVLQSGGTAAVCGAGIRHVSTG
jgi:CRP/FNR family cyclic AMP-dependent transcriptional regulator